LRNKGENYENASGIIYYRYPDYWFCAGFPYLIAAEAPADETGQDL
jgi:hypothetical protein